jgi:hypothetical protein
MTDKPENEREKEININLLFKSIIHKSEKNEHAFATSNKGRICAHSNLNFEYFSINPHITEKAEIKNVMYSDDVAALFTEFTKSYFCFFIIR